MEEKCYGGIVLLLLKILQQCVFQCRCIGLCLRLGDFHLFLCGSLHLYQIHYFYYNQTLLDFSVIVAWKVLPKVC